MIADKHVATPRDTPRRHRRVPLKVEVKSQASGETSPGRAGNISEGGLLIHAARPFDVGTEVLLCFRLPGGRRVETLGLVRHRSVGGQTGLMFVQLNPAAREAIAEYITQVRPYDRRSARIPRRYEVLLRWHDLEGEAHEEPAYTMLLSKQGGLAACLHRFKAGEDAALWWPEQGRGADIRIVFRQLGGLGELAEIAFEFKDSDDFWSIQFPPDVLFE